MKVNVDTSIDSTQSYIDARRRKQGSKDFRQLLDEITMLMGYEINVAYH